MWLSPVGLSTVTKLTPVKLLGIMMGVWFLAAAFGNKLAGYLGGFLSPTIPRFSLDSTAGSPRPAHLRGAVGISRPAGSPAHGGSEVAHHEIRFPR